jgi:hypothetical protein
MGFSHFAGNRDPDSRSLPSSHRVSVDQQHHAFGEKSLPVPSGKPKLSPGKKPVGFTESLVAHLGQPLLGRYSCRQPLASFGSPPVNNFAAAFGGHPSAETVLPEPFDSAGLISPFHIDTPVLSSYPKNEGHI